MTATWTGSGRKQPGSAEPQTTVRPPVFVGRDADFSRLSAALSRPDAVILVDGEGGVGKSRLVAECVENLRDRLGSVAVASCPPFSEPFTLAPLVGALRACATEPKVLRDRPSTGALRRLLPDWADFLPAAPVPLASSHDEHRRLLNAMAEAICALGIGVLVIEDMHWADEATVDLLLLLVGEWPNRPALVMTYRREDLAADSLVTRLATYASRHPHALQLSLSALDPAASEALVASMLGGCLDPALTAFLHERTDGVPLLLQELVRFMHDRRDIAWRESAWFAVDRERTEVPTTIRDFVRERVSRCSHVARKLLRAEAVLSEQADLTALACVSGLSAYDAETAAHECLHVGLLRSDGIARLRFAHVLVEQAVYEDIPVVERTRLHRIAGEMLQRATAPNLTRLTRHFRAAGDLDRWSAYAEQAGDLALEMGDEAAAIQILQALVAEQSLEPATRIRLARRLAAAAVSRRSERAISRGEIIRSLIDVLSLRPIDPESRGLLEESLARLLFQDGRPSEALTHLQLAVPQLTNHPLESARVMALLGWPEHSLWPRETHMHWLKRAQRAAASASPRERLFMEVDQMTALLGLGNPEGWEIAERLPSVSDTSAERLQITRGLVNSGNGALIWGRYRDARRRLNRALRLAEAERTARLHDVALCTVAQLDWLTGNWSGLPERVTELVGEPDRKPQSRVAALQIIALLHALAEDSQPAAAEALQPMADTMTDFSPNDLSFSVVGVLAQVLLRTGAVDAALRCLSPAIDVIRSKRVWLWSADVIAAQVDGLVRSGRADEAAQCIREASDGVGDIEAPAVQVALGFARGILAQGTGECTQAAREFASAERRWRAMPRRREALLAAVHAGMCRTALGDERAGRPQISSAHSALERMGARVDAAWAQSLLVLRSGPLRVNPSETTGRALTPRELRAIALVITGRTDREIARDMDVSVNTVISHLASARRKLNVRSRTELAVLALERGLVDEAAHPGSGTDYPA